MSRTISNEGARYFIEYLHDEVYHMGNLDALAAIYSDPHIFHGSSNQWEDEGKSISQMAQEISLLRAAFPDLKISVEKVIASTEEGTVDICCCSRFEGTHRGWLQGVAPTFRQVSVVSLDIYSLSGGKIVEEWGSFDILGMLRQLGVLPPGY